MLAASATSLFDFIFLFFISIFMPLPSHQIINESIAWNAQSRVGSLDNKDHKPGGGNIHVRTVCLSVCVRPSICLSVIVPITHHPFTSDCLFKDLSVCLSVHRSVYLSVIIPIAHHPFTSVCLF